MLRITLLFFVFSFFVWNPYESWAQTENTPDSGSPTSDEYYDDIQESSGLLEIEEQHDKMAASEEFKMIGSRLFYIEKEMALDWFAASNLCYQLGGRLATIRSKEELNIIVPQLVWDSGYWLDINDLSEEGRFVLSASDEPAAFLSWRKGQPDNYNQNEHCVQLINYYMYDSPCGDKRYFICEALD